MRTQLTVPGSNLGAYLYQQYADDDDLQAFVEAYNNGAQTIVDWFNDTNLAYYPALSGPLLDFIAQGLYGLTRTQLATQASPALGPLNTEALNTDTLNDYTPGTQTFYSLSDDVFQRILTWHLFRGDGRVFTVRWLKRRVMRFLAGANGIDPQPFTIAPDGTVSLNAGFGVGAETTSAIGVTIASGVLTVSIDQTRLSLQAPNVTPGILNLFQLAFQGGYLELPLQYTYVVTITTGFDALAEPNVLTSITSAFAQTAGPTSVMTLGGSGIYTYAWTWQSGGSGITIDSPSAVTTAFTASGLAFGQTVTGVALCTVTDTVSSDTALATCLVTITCVAPDALTLEGSPLTLDTEGGVPLVVEP